MMRKVIRLGALIALAACGAPADDEALDGDSVELGNLPQAWVAKKASLGHRTWGARENTGNTSCDSLQSTSSTCYFHGHNGFDTLDMVVKYWVNPQWTDAEDAMIQGMVDLFISNANVILGGGQAQLPWSFSRLTGNVQPTDANVVIQAGFASGTLGSTVGQYTNVNWNDTRCLELAEPTAVNGTYRACHTVTAFGTGVNTAVISFDLGGLEAYMFQQGYSEAAKTDTRRHVLWHSMIAELGMGGTDTTQNSASRTTFSKTNRISAVVSGEEACRWRGLKDAIAQAGNPGDQTNYRIGATLCQ